MAKRCYFWSKVDQSGGPESCWPWIGARTASRPQRGYLKRDGKNIYAHRMAFVLCNGPIPNGLCVCHSCDNPICCNPSHLWLGTQAENTRDRDVKGRCRARGPSGEASGMAKLTAQMVLDIRLAYIPGQITLAQVGKRFGISESHVSRIVRNHYWKQEVTP